MGRGGGTNGVVEVGEEGIYINEQGRAVYTSSMTRVDILYRETLLWETIFANFVEGLQFMKISSAIIVH